jgi:CheY-like chemotaxis protein
MLERLLGADVELVCSLDPEVRAIHCPQGSLEQVLLNLIINARDAMPAGGRISVTTQRVWPEAGTDQVHALLRVEDSGEGMDTATAERAFEPFFSTKQAGGGTGLGLATVESIIRQADGQIAVHSSPGSGARFDILFKEGIEAPPAAAATETELRGGQETVLVVEDEPAIRDLCVEALQAVGYRVLMAASGEQALALIRDLQGPLDLIVTDVILPGLRGDRLADAVLALRPGTPLLLMSGYPPERITGMAYLQKPFTPTGLLREVRRILDTLPAPGNPRPGVSRG